MFVEKETVKISSGMAAIHGPGRRKFIMIQ